MISNFTKGSRYFGFYLAIFSVFITISGVGMVFSRKERERTRARVTAELPDRAKLINKPDADKIVQRRGYYTIALGIALFLIWYFFFGFATLTIGV